MATAVPALAAEKVSGSPKILAVVAHPDDEYAFAASAYRFTHELKATVDQIVITNGEAGFRYSQLAEAYYGLPLTTEAVGRDRLPALRKAEAERAGRILGIRKHWFLDQRDARFTLNGREAFSGIWDTDFVAQFLSAKLKQEKYDFVVIMLPTPETHGHHQAAGLLTAEAVRRLPESERPVLLGAEASGTEAPSFKARADNPLFETASAEPGWRVNRLDAVPGQPALSYNVIVNWVIAEHKSQGLFQTESGKHSFENFWLFETNSPSAVQKTEDLFRSLKYQVRSRR